MSDRFYGRGFQPNITNALNEEIFGYGYQGNPNYDLMDEPEIPVERTQDHHRNYDHPQQMHQMYYDNARYGNDGYQSPRHGPSHPYAPQRAPFDYNQETEYPSYEISVNIRLSRRGRVDLDQLRIGLQRETLRCDVRGNDLITVSGYPRDDGADGFLALVKRISGDRGASIVG